jgi:DNA repair protein RadC
VSASCRSHHRPQSAIRSAAAAVRTLRLATDNGAYDCAVVACVDGARRPLTLFVFDGRIDLDDDLELAVDAIIAAAASAESPLGAIFLGSSRRAGEPGPSPADERRWVRMADRCADAGIELLDWFLIDAGAVCSVAEGLLPGPGW